MSLEAWVVMPGRAFLFLLLDNVFSGEGQWLCGNARSGIFVFASSITDDEVCKIVTRW